MEGIQISFSSESVSDLHYLHSSFFTLHQSIFNLSVYLVPLFFYCAQLKSNFILIIYLIFVQHFVLNDISFFSLYIPK